MNDTHNDIWHMNYNKTVTEQAAKGWNGVFLVLAFNVLMFLLALGIFLHLSRSGRTSLYCHGRHPPQLPGNSSYDKFIKFITSFNNVSALHYELGDEGAFYLLFQLDAFRLLTFMSIVAFGILIPVYLYCATDSHTSFEAYTIRTLPDQSPLLWIPVLTCYGFALAFGVFISRLSALCNNRDTSKTNLLCMRPSELSARSLFINRGLPKKLNEKDIFNCFESIFPGYVTDVAVVLNLTEYKSLRNTRDDKEKQLARIQTLMTLQQEGREPWILRICPGNAIYPSFSFLCSLPNDQQERRILAHIRMLKEAEKEALQRAVDSNVGAGRAFIIFTTPQNKADFVRRVRNQNFSSILANFSDRVRPRAKLVLKKLEIANWHLLSAPEPTDIDWDSLSYPFTNRTIRIVAINILLFLFLTVFTSPIAITSSLASGAYSGVTDFIQRLVDKAVFITSNFSPTVSKLIGAYSPTLVLVMVNAMLVNILYYAGRLQPIATDSGKEQQILRTSAIYLIFNTLFVPSLAFASIDALFLYLRANGKLLGTLGEMFLHNSGTFFVAFVIQRALVGTAIQLLRITEVMEFSWYRMRAVTEQEKRDAIAPWKFYSGIRSALQISVLAVVVSFSTVVPIIVPFGAFYMIMQHLVDKYTLIYVRPQIPGRGAISRTATHCCVFCLIIYLTGMSGFFLVRGTDMQSSAMLFLLIVTYVITLWWYLNDKRMEYLDTAKAGQEEEQRLLLADQIALYREPALRSSLDDSTQADRYGSILH